ncbi:MAG TPA: glycosyltransferase [Candidatus Margulisiibacteriota bacterium]|nr:glycosyltransferase [Candidatus Margulisiibacteriota bacterium]
MADADEPNAIDSAAKRLLARFTEQTAIRRLARGLAGELLLADHEGDIVDPTLDPRVFTQVPADLAPDRYAYAGLLIGGEGYLPGCLVVGAALRWHVHTAATLVCMVDDSVPQGARDMLGRIYDRVPVIQRLRAHDSAYPSELLSDAYRDMYTKLRLFDATLFPYARVCFVDADLLPIRCFDHLFTLPAPAAVIESVDPTSQYMYVHHMHGVRHGERVPPAILEVTSDEDVTGGINAGLLVVRPDRARFEDMVARIQRPMPEWGPRHRQLYDRGIRYGFPEQHFLQVEFQDAWTAIDPRFNSMRTDLPHSFGVHWTIGRKPWQNLDNAARSVSMVLWAMAWETLRLHHPDICAELEQRGLVRGKPA